MLRRCSLILLAGLVSLAVLHPRASAQPYGSLMDLIISSPDLNTLEILVNATGLDVVLSNTNLSATAFLPTDTAISNFLVNVLGLSGGVAALNVSDPLIKSGLTKLLQYHLVDSPYSLEKLAFIYSLLGTNIDLSTFLYKNEFLGKNYQPAYSKLNFITTDNKTSQQPIVATIFDTNGKSVQVNSNISINNGTAYGYIIDSVLIYWYPTMWQALTANNLTSLQSALTVASKTPGGTNWPEIFASPNASYTLFGLTNTAFDNALQKYRINLLDASDASIDILKYHISTDVRTIGPPYSSAQNFVYSTMSNQKSASLLFQINGSANDPNILLTGFNGDTVYIRAAQIPVGGFVPKAYLGVTDYAVFPVYTDALTALKASGSDYKVFATLVQGNSKSDGVVPLMRSTLGDPTSSVTVLSPNPAGWKAFTDKYGISDVATFYGTNLNRLLAGHVLAVSSNSSQIQIPGLYPTFIPGQVISTGMVNGSGFMKVAFGTGVTTARMAASSNVPVMYGRSYLYVVDYVLVPRSVGLPPQDGAAFMVSPSFLMLLLLQGCALVAAHMVGAFDAL